MGFRSPFIVLLSITALASASAVFAADSAVNVVVDMTTEGRRATQPALNHPIFYYPVMAGYQARGVSVAGEVPPPPMEVANLVAKGLASQGYFSCTYDPTKAVPQLVLVIHWGYMNPDVGDNASPGEDSMGQSVYNRSQEISLVGGNTMKNLDLDFEKEVVMQGIEFDRYFVVVSAYDLHAYLGRKQKKVLLWQAKLSVPTNGTNFTAVLPALVEAGAPHFGKETIRPVTIPISTAAGTVKIGPVEVKGYSEPTAKAPAPSK